VVQPISSELWTVVTFLRQPIRDARVAAASVPLTERPVSLLCTYRPPDTPQLPSVGPEELPVPPRSAALLGFAASKH